MIATTCPVTINQEVGLYWRALTRLVDDSLRSAYLQRTLRFRGKLDVLSLQRALGAVVDRHSALRAAFGLKKDVSSKAAEEHVRRFGRTSLFGPDIWTQTVLPTMTVDLPIVDLEQVSVKDRPAIMRKHYERFIKRNTIREDPPHLYSLLFRCTSREHLLVIVVDHIVADAYSMKIILRDLDALYLHYSQHGPWPEPSIVGQYPAFAVWQRRMIRSGHYKDALVFWRQEWVNFASERLLYSDLPSFSSADDFHANVISG